MAPRGLFSESCPRGELFVRPSQTQVPHQLVVSRIPGVRGGEPCEYLFPGCLPKSTGLQSMNGNHSSAGHPRDEQRNPKGHESVPRRVAHCRPPSELAFLILYALNIDWVSSIKTRRNQLCPISLHRIALRRTCRKSQASPRRAPNRLPAILPSDSESGSSPCFSLFSSERAGRFIPGTNLASLISRKAKFPRRLRTQLP